MIGRLRQLGQIRPPLLALLLLCLAPAFAGAETFYIRNDSNIPVVVQAGSVVRGVLRRVPPCQLKPGEVAPAIQLPGNKIITIYDARTPNRLLYQNAHPATTDDQYFGIVHDVPPQVKLEMRRPFPPRVP